MADENQPPEEEENGQAPEERADQDDQMDPDKLAEEVGQEADDPELADEWAAAMEEAGETGDDESDSAEEGAERAPLEELKDDSVGRADGTSPDLEVILDIPVTISMEVGRTNIAIRNLLQLNQGSVIELDRLAGEPLDVLVNGTLIAHGEVVMVNEKFGIRLTDVVSQQERISRLNN
ncbi:flagellar motor switch protein FliN [Natronospirillum operosum]|uniref:Flagellar motor switch protein FliN n=1 Tax=Natronospirillum operosum TaxID=2759953 RepID=A0A4Z0WHD7_9GAMM|nr:flagellar motor switch protein FliN [Natronospirillum operosum]TGG95968.1 flagellar motor switch protein FliN [Natronospirillum operosum]